MKEEQKISNDNKNNNKRNYDSFIQPYIEFMQSPFSYGLINLNQLVQLKKIEDIWKVEYLLSLVLINGMWADVEYLIKHSFNIRSDQKLLFLFYQVLLLALIILNLF